MKPKARWRTAIKRVARRIGPIAPLMRGDIGSIDRWSWLRRRFVEDSGRVLDAGCGRGGITLWIANRANEAVGVSFDERVLSKATRHARRFGIDNAHFRVGDLRELSRQKDLGSFDAIVCFEVIEHLVDDERLLRDLAVLARPGARLYLTTPSIYRKPLLNESVSDVEDGSHVRWGYDHEKLRSILQRAGWTVVEQSHVSGAVTHFVSQTHRRIARFSTYAGKLVQLSLWPLRPLDGVITQALKWPHICVAVVCERR